MFAGGHSGLRFSNWIGLQKRPPQVRFDLLEMQALKGENRTCGGQISQANPSNPSGKLAFLGLRQPTMGFYCRNSICPVELKVSGLSLFLEGFTIPVFALATSFQGGCGVRFLIVTIVRLS